MIEATADEAVINANRHLLKDDELIIVMAKMQPDRFSGWFRLSISQVWDLATARCRFGKFLRVAVNGKAPDIKRLVSEFPPRREISDQGELVRGLGVRLWLKREVGTWPSCSWGRRRSSFPATRHWPAGWPRRTKAAPRSCTRRPEKLLVGRLRIGSVWGNAG